ncbi:hypothetical protein [Magnetofaba australis]|uniref:Uncharacterized protein n=1 Tax=Magnetofaba australis IT-1 TaxID=1434232 RepID=A0A1Y2KB10_9PROT|nr:hypothetical protein [Magnetofaba australis]OSM06995.1 hypothetical protein MAIT1_00104 [Magnetofaba australis IT-1]
MPRTPAHDTLRQINKIFNQTPEPDPFTLRRLKKEAEQQLSSEPEFANLSLARLACLNHEPAQMESWHKSHINLLPGQAQPHLEYGASLRKLGFFTAARDRALLAHEVDPAHQGVIQQIIRDAILCGAFHQAHEWMRRSVDESQAPVYRKLYHFLQGVLELFDQREISDAALQQVQERALALLRAQEVYPAGVLRKPAVALELNQTESGPLVSWRIQLRQSEEEIERFNEELQAELESWPQPPMLRRYVHFHFSGWRETIPTPYGFYM